MEKEITSGQNFIIFCKKSEKSHRLSVIKGELETVTYVCREFVAF